MIFDKFRHDDASAVPDADSAKKRQYALLAAGLLFLGAILWTVLTVMSPSEKKDEGPGKPVKPTGAVQAPGSALSPQDVWVLKGDKEQAAINEKLKELSAAVDILSQKLQPIDSPAAQNLSAASPVIIPRATAANGAILPPSMPLPPGAPPQTFPAATSMHTTTTPAQAAAVDTQEIEDIVIPPSPQREPSRPLTQAAPVKEGEAKKVRKVGTWLPAGTTTKAIIVGGIDAPTGGQAQSNPHPVLLQLLDNSILPNNFKTKTKECRLIGAGFGDISSERAYIRLVTLSCVLKTGEVIEQPVKGGVFGEDGKYGVRGKLHSKQGQIIAKALLAGVLSGIGTGMAQQGATLSVSPLGATQTFDPSRVFERGAYIGVGRAMDRLAQYYVENAAKTFPIIEINAMREVDVVLESGADLELDINQNSNVAGLDDDDTNGW